MKVMGTVCYLRLAASTLAYICMHACERMDVVRVDIICALLFTLGWTHAICVRVCFGGAGPLVKVFQQCLKVLQGFGQVPRTLCNGINLWLLLHLTPKDVPIPF